MTTKLFNAFLQKYSIHRLDQIDHTIQRQRMRFATPGHGFIERSRR
jgi:hypothetical protein